MATHKTHQCLNSVKTYNITTQGFILYIVYIYIYIYIYIYKMSENFMFFSVTLYISVLVRRTICKINKPPDRNNVYIITHQRTQDKQH